MASSTVSFVWSRVELLSGGLDDCQDADDESCSGGVAAVRAYLRHHSDGIDDANLVINRLDYQSVFVQMHPLQWAVNRLVLRDRFGWEAAFVYGSILTQSRKDSPISQRDLTPLQSTDFSPLIGNYVVSTSNSWSQYVKNVYFHGDTGLATLMISNGRTTTGDTQADEAVKSIPHVEAATGLLNYIAQENEAKGCSDSPAIYNQYFLERNMTQSSHIETDRKCWVPIVLYEESSNDLFQEFMEAVHTMKNPPALVTQQSSDDFPLHPVPVQVGPHGVWVVSYTSNYGEVKQVRLTVSDDRRTVINVELQGQSLSPIPEELKDDMFREDILYLRELADEARSNNPVRGYSKFMPLSNDPVDITLRPCMGGECPLGNLFTDALRWYTGADFAFIQSGGIRGPGWQEGPVRESDIWASLPFANTQCTGIISGINVFRLFEHSTSNSSFLSTWHEKGDRLFQVSGFRYTYNTQLEAPRLVGLEIWDALKDDYVPVERLKFYTFATDSWMCSGFDPFPTLLGEGLTIEGEEPKSIGDTLLQTIVGDYLSTLKDPYDTGIQGRLVNNTDIETRLDFIQTEDSCNSTTYWVEKYLSCLACPSTDKVIFKADQVEFQSLSGDAATFPSWGEIFNGEEFPITIALKSKPSWVSFPLGDVERDEEVQKIELAPSELFSFEYEVTAADLEAGVATAPISFAVLDGGGFPGCVGRDAILDVTFSVDRKPEYFQPGSILIVGFTLMALALATSLCCALWVYRNRFKPAVKALQPNFLLALAFGAFVIALSIAPLSIQSLDVSDRGQDIACMATPWLLSTGFTIVMSTLFAKLWAVNKIFDGRRFQRITVTNTETAVAFSIMSVLNFTLMLIWTLVAPLSFSVQQITNPGDDWKLYGTCQPTTTGSKIFVGLTIGLNALALLLAAYEAFKARNVSDAYSESKSLGFAVFSWLQILFIGIPVMFLIEDDNVNPKYFVQVALIILSCMSMLLIVYIPLMMKVRAAERAGVRRTQVHVSGMTHSALFESAPMLLNDKVISSGLPPLSEARANACSSRDNISSNGNTHYSAGPSVPETISETKVLEGDLEVKDHGPSAKRIDAKNNISAVSETTIDA